MVAPGTGLERFIPFPPMQAALIAMAVIGLTSMAQYAIFVVPYQQRVERWIRDPHLRGEV